VADVGGPAAAREHHAGRGRLDVLQAPPQALLVDAGRSGWAHLAITRAGAYDADAYSRANRLVGNHEGAAAVEFVLGPLVLRTLEPCLVAVAGVDAAVAVHLPGRAARSFGTEESIHLAPGAEVMIEAARRGLRGYVAVRGGIEVDPVLGSRSRDTLAGLGPPPLRPGDALVIGDRSGALPVVAHLPRPGPPEASHTGHSLPLLPAPRSRAARLLPDTELGERSWTVSPHSDRVGMRLLGEPLPVRPDPGAPSEPLVRGAVQVPPDGCPVIMGPDHPTTGGYPVIGVVARPAWGLLAQLRPGDQVRLVPQRAAPLHPQGRDGRPA